MDLNVILFSFPIVKGFMSYSILSQWKLRATVTNSL